MTQRDRDRMVALKKARKGLITQRQAAEEIGQSERHVRRLLNRLKGKGDGALVHALRGRSNRRLDEKTKQKALEILGRDVYRGFGPTLAAEYLAKQHDIHVGREMARTWMIEGKLWRASRQRVDKIHSWRPRRSRVGEHRSQHLSTANLPEIQFRLEQIAIGVKRIELCIHTADISCICQPLPIFISNARSSVLRPHAAATLNSYLTAIVTGELTCPASAIDKTTVGPGVTPFGTTAFT